MAKQFAIDCPQCRHEVDFDLCDIPELDRHFHLSIDQADAYASDAKDREYQDYIDPVYLTGGERTLWELAAAIRRGDVAEAELHLDRLADEIGLPAVEEVQQGRFSNRARAA